MVVRALTTGPRPEHSCHPPLPLRHHLTTPPLDLPSPFTPPRPTSQTRPLHTVPVGSNETVKNCVLKAAQWKKRNWLRFFSPPMRFSFNFFRSMHVRAFSWIAKRVSVDNSVFFSIPFHAHKERNSRRYFPNCRRSFFELRPSFPFERSRSISLSSFRPSSTELTPLTVLWRPP